MKSETTNEALLEAALAGELGGEQRVEFNARLRRDPEFFSAYCGQVRLHALLTWSLKPVEEPPLTAVAGTLPDTPWASQPRLWHRWAAAVAAAVLALTGTLFVLLPTPVDASAALTRMIEAARRNADRTYAISVLEGEPTQSLNNGQTLTYEGARLHLRNGAQFVLIRPLSGGGQRVTGSDGQLNWDLTGPGPVRVSRDPGRFRGGLPGEQQDLTFLDLTGQLAELRQGYDITMAVMAEKPDFALLTAVKKSRATRGPTEIALVFHRESGVVSRYELRGLPRGKGGPKSLRLKLLSEESLPPDFFQHNAHHEPSRRVIEETERRSTP